MTENLTSDDILSGAIDALQTRGHVKRRLFDPEGVCLYGALAVAAGYNSLSQLPSYWYGTGPIKDAANRLSQVLFGVEMDPLEDTHTLVNWNNAPERTGEDVILALKRALHETSDV